MFGSHLSISGTMVNAVLRAEHLGFDTVQVFTKNQQQWKVKPLDPGMVKEWRSHINRLGWQGRTVSHASYLINLASPNDELWAKSIDLQTVEVERCEELGIPFLVHHPGAFTTSTLEAGQKRIADAYREVFKRTKGFKNVSCLEGTAGGGSTIGGQFEHLARARDLIVEATGEPARVGFCLDTCHMHAAGYDMATRAAANAAFDLFDQVCGLKSLRVMHINDSKGAVGSKLDRHMHIGEGLVGGGLPKPTPASLKASGFAAVVNRPELRSIPKILETPKEEDDKPGPVPDLPDGTKSLDTINLERLKSLMEDSKPAASRPRTKS